jgi:flagellar hook protein FlgE
MTLTLDFGSTTQYGAPFAVNAITQDGYTTGQLCTIDIDSEGIVFARYSNGQARALGQVVLTNFANPNGLRSMGDNGWAETSDSGVPLTGLPGSGNLGLLQSGALEESNVDITEQLVSMITAQRNFQANAQVIQTEDTITQTVINIR